MSSPKRTLRRKALQRMRRELRSVNRTNGRQASARTDQRLDALAAACERLGIKVEGKDS